MLRGAAAGRCAAPCSPRSRQPARAAAGDARLAGRAARRRRRPRSCPTRAPRWRARSELAGPDGAVLATGSIYLVADLRAREPGRRQGVGAVNERGPSVLAMVALVAVVVALVILVFFAHRLRLRSAVPVTPAALRFELATCSASRSSASRTTALNTAVNVLLLVLVVVWVALIFWTFADARRRIDDPMLVACATAASLFPFVGTIVYLIVRPPEFLDDVRAARAGDDRRRGASRAARLPAVPALRLRDQGRLPALPELHAQAQGALLLVRQAGRPGVEGVPVLRGGDAGRAATAGHAASSRPLVDD